MRLQAMSFLGCVVLSAAGAAFAGTISPPPGPVAPTMKTLDQVEPRIPINATNTPGNASSVFNISGIGSYYLTGNVIGQPGKNGITVLASDVTIDLNGFTLVGVPGSFSGIATIGVRSLAIHDGAIQSWGGDGVNSAAIGAVFSGLVARSNGARGIAAMSFTIIRDCVAQENGNIGIDAFDDCAILSCAARGNGAAGIRQQNSGLIKDCISANNSTHGIMGGINLTVVDCIVEGHTIPGAIGIKLGQRAIVSGCNIALSNQEGIAVGSWSLVRDCLVYNSGTDGIALDSQCTAVSCTSDSSTGNGISGVFNCVIDRCRAGNSGADGIHVQNNASVTGCFVRVNGDDGISVGANSTVIGCRSTENVYGFFDSGTAGIVFDGNIALLNVNTGFLIVNGSHLVIRNVARQNGANFSAVGGSQVGPIITATGTITSVNPWANFADAIPFAATNAELPLGKN